MRGRGSQYLPYSRRLHLEDGVFGGVLAGEIDSSKLVRLVPLPRLWFAACW